jgi:hypothetical protein
MNGKRQKPSGKQHFQLSMNRKLQNFTKRQKTNWVAQLSPLYTALKDESVRWRKIQSRLHGSNAFNKGGRKNQNRNCVNCFGKKQAESNAAHRVSTILASAGLDLA